MAEIILGLGSPHSPQLSIPPSRLALLVEKDQKDPRIDYANLLRVAKPGIQQELTEQKLEARYDAAQRALDDLSKILVQASPDVLSAIGDDQHEQFLDDAMPMFCVFRGNSLKMVKREFQQAWRKAEEPDTTDQEFPAHPALAEHLISSLVQQGFDVACCNQLRENIGLGHAFSFVYRRLWRDCRAPMVPIMLNTFYPPNQPTPQRCYAFGRALRAAIESWKSSARVGVITTGGLSHVVVDEDLDRMTLDGLMHKDPERLGSLPVEKLQLGTSEIRNWIALGGMLEQLPMKLLDYIPAYRSPAGTGCGMAFAQWG